MSDVYETAQDAEDAFYDAFEEGEIGRMMSAWSPGEDIACIQPMRLQAVGRDAVRKAWEELFSSDATVEVEVLHQHWIEQGDTAIHIVHERVIVNGDRRNNPPPLIATNIYRHGADGWRMVLHHVSPPPPPPGMMPGMPPGAGMAPGHPV